MSARRVMHAAQHTRRGASSYVPGFEPQVLVLTEKHDPRDDRSRVLGAAGAMRPVKARGTRQRLKTRPSLWARCLRWVQTVLGGAR